MNSMRFLYWLRGFFEVNDVVALSLAQRKAIENKLYAVFENKHKAIHPVCLWLKEYCEQKNKIEKNHVLEIREVIDTCFEESDKTIFDSNVCFWLQGALCLGNAQSLNEKQVSKLSAHFKKAEKQEMPEFEDLQNWLENKKSLSKDEVLFLKAWANLKTSELEL